jgi:hypothetical protein
VTTKEDGMDGTYSTRGRDVYSILDGKSEGKRPLGRPRRRWEDNIRMDLSEIGFGYVDWMHQAEDRGEWRSVVNTVMNLWAS